MKTQEFIGRLVQENGELVSKMQACKAPEEAYEVAKSAGLTDSFEEFTAEMTKVYESVKNLTEDDLAKVAGGMDASEIVSIVTFLTVEVTTMATVVVSLGAIAAASP